MSGTMMTQPHALTRRFRFTIYPDNSRSGLGSVALLFACVSCLTLHAREDFPYVAHVATTDALVRSGPGEAFYATARIRHGESVEVYRHLDDGWCAIRPLPDSFSWLSAEHLEITDNPQLARVINVPAKTRVGSHLEDAFDVEYISLRKGEIVELLGSDLRAEFVDDVPVRWFKIAPPAGEFRFLHRSQLTAANSQETAAGDVRGTVAGDAAPEPLESDDIPTYSLDAKPRNPGLLPAENVADAVPLDAAVASTQDSSTGFSELQNQARVRQVSFEQHASNVSRFATPHSLVANPGATRESSETVEGTMTAEDAGASVSSPHVNAVTWEAVGQPTNPLASPEPRTFVDQYNALNIMLSRAVLGDAERWKLDKLQLQAERLVELAQSVEQQTLAEGLADKVHEFRTLQRRRRELDSSSAPHPLPAIADAQPLPLPNIQDPSQAIGSGVRQTSLLEDVVEMPQRVAQTTATLPTSGLDKREVINNSIFDASGQLIAVNTRRDDIPKYAVTNRHGDIIRFVSTKDGSSLTSYVNRQVGILGTKGFIPSLNKPHIVADRVVLLQR